MTPPKPPPEGFTRWPGLVDDNALAVPWDHELRNILKDPAGRLLDENMIHVEQARGYVDRQMGRRLEKFGKVNGFRRLGCVGVGMYGTDRLQVGCRTAQEIRRVGRALENLPLMRKACDEGRLLQAHVRELTRVATPENEGQWVKEALGLTVLILKAKVKAARLADPAGAEPGEEDEDDQVVVSMQGPASFRAK